MTEVAPARPYRSAPPHDSAAFGVPPSAGMRYSGDPLGVRIDALGELLGLSRTRISPDALAGTGELLTRVGERRRLPAHHTVVALAGATGSGKSSLFNMLTGRELSAAGVRRPTTGRPVACSWSPGGASGLLDRLGIEPEDRHTARGPMRVPAPPGGPDGPAGIAHCSVGDAHGTGEGLAGAKELSLEGLVLIDLPDHDSAATGHREQVDRLLQLVDVVVWVLDPEKYADAALHERYLRPSAGHADVTVLVLNQVDRLGRDAADLVLDDLRRLLDEDGLAVGEHGEAGAVVLAASALTGQGVADLRAVLAQTATERAAAARRLTADLDRAASSLRPLYVGEGGAGLTDPAREEFIDRLGDAVGASAAGQSAERDWGRAARDACGTPWGRLLGERPAPESCSGIGRRKPDQPHRGTPQAADTPFVSRAVVDEAVRGLAADVALGLPEPWARAVHDAARSGGAGLAEALDAAAGRAAAGTPDRPGWWSVARGVQWLLTALVLAGAVCMTAVLTGWLRWPWWAPLVLSAVGVLGGPLVSAVCRIAARGPARRFGQAAERRLRDAAADCGRTRVLEPVAAEFMRYREVREQYAVVSGAVPRPVRHSHR